MHPVSEIHSVGETGIEETPAYLRHVILFYRRMECDCPERRFEMVRTALLLGFTALLRGGGVGNLQRGDTHARLEDETPYVTIYIRISKTDQEGKAFL